MWGKKTSVVLQHLEVRRLRHIQERRLRRWARRREENQEKKSFLKNK